MKYTLIFLLAGWAFNTLAQTSYVPTTYLLKKRGYQIQLGGDYFKTSKTVDFERVKRDLNDGDSFERAQGELGGLWGASDNLQFGLGARFRMNQSNSTFNGVDYTAKSSGIQAISLGIQYAFKRTDRNQVTLESLFRYTPYTNEVFTATSDREKMILGDDGNELSFGLGLTHAFKSNDYLTGRVGYRRPGGELSAEAYWQAEGALVWKHIALIAGVDGISSLGNDPDGDDPIDGQVYNTGVTALYNSVNRELIAPYVGLNLALGQQWRLELRGTQVVDGRSTDLGTGFGIQIVRRVDKIDKMKIDARFKTYDLEANVMKVSEKKNFVTIDKGLGSDVEKGMIFDFYEFDYIGGNILVAQGIVIQSKVDSAVVKITNRYNSQKEIKPGLVGRAQAK